MNFLARVILWSTHWGKTTLGRSKAFSLGMCFVHIFFLQFAFLWYVIDIIVVICSVDRQGVRLAVPLLSLGAHSRLEIYIRLSEVSLKNTCQITLYHVMLHGWARWRIKMWLYRIASCFLSNTTYQHATNKCMSVENQTKASSVRT